MAQLTFVAGERPLTAGGAVSSEVDRAAAASVMAGLVPAIHAVLRAPDNVDARDKPGHDDLS